MVTEFRNVHLNALSGGDVQELATAAVRGVGGGEFLTLPEKHNPPPGVEAVVLQDAPQARVCGTSPPRQAHTAKSDVVGHIVSEGALGDQARWPLIKIRPVPQGKGGDA